jgi:hypothetical protein
VTTLSRWLAQNKAMRGEEQRRFWRRLASASAFAHGGA